MIEINVAAVPTQSLSIQLEGKQYDLDLREVVGGVSVSIVRDGVALVSNLRATPGTPLLPYGYQEVGNFILTTEAEALPDFSQFGVTQFLLYVTPEELGAFRG